MGERAVGTEEVADIEEYLGVKVTPDSLTDMSPIKEFWLKAMKNSDVLGEEIKEKDEEVLQHLTDVKVAREFQGAKEKSMTLTFTFSDNEWFSNSTLTKKFILDERDGHAVSSVGTEIEWKDDKNITRKTVKKQ